MCSYVRCARMTDRWPTKLFMNLLDVAKWNSLIIITRNVPDLNKNNLYRWMICIFEVAKLLAEDHMKRGQIPTLKEVSNRRQWPVPYLFQQYTLSLLLYSWQEEDVILSACKETKWFFSCKQFRESSCPMTASNDVRWNVTCLINNLSASLGHS